MKTALPLSLLPLLFAGAACAEPTRTVDWYQKHPFVRADLLRQCRDNPGELAATPNCINAEKAEALHSLSGASTVFPKGAKPLEAKDFDIPAWRK